MSRNFGGGSGSSGGSAFGVQLKPKGSNKAPPAANKFGIGLKKVPSSTATATNGNGFALKSIGLKPGASSNKVAGETTSKSASAGTGS